MPSLRDSDFEMLSAASDFRQYKGQRKQTGTQQHKSKDAHCFPFLIRALSLSQHFKVRPIIMSNGYTMESHTLTQSCGRSFLNCYIRKLHIFFLNKNFHLCRYSLPRCCINIHICRGSLLRVNFHICRGSLLRESIPRFGNINSVILIFPIQ